jgi:hypothetical protein
MIFVENNMDKTACHKNAVCFIVAKICEMNLGIF